MKLTCRQIQELITDLFNQTISPSDNDQVQKHIVECKECAKYYDQLKQQDALLSEYIDDLNADMPQRMQKAMAVVADLNNQKISARPSQNMKFLKRISIGIAAAAIITVSVFGYLYFAGGLGDNKQPAPLPVAKDIDVDKSSEIQSQTDVDIELKLVEEEQLINQMLADNDIAGLIDMLDKGQKVSKVRTAQALMLIGDASALAKLEEINSIIPSDAKYNPFAEAIAAITERITAEQAKDRKEQKAEPEVSEPNAVDTSVEDDFDDVDNAEEGVFGLKVIEEDTGKAVAGVTVKLSMNKGYKSEAITDEYGRCDFEYGTEDVPTYFYIKVNKAGYVPKILRFRVKDLGHEIPLQYTLQLEPGTVVGGYVKTEDGQPVKDAKVEINIYDDRDNEIEHVNVRDLKCVTDKDGKWFCDQIPEKVYEIYAVPEHSEYVRATRYSTTPSIESLRDQSVVLYMMSPITVTGYVLDLDGNAVKDAKVFTGVSRYSGDKAEYKTDQQGKFVIEKCLFGQLVLTVKAKGFAQDMKVLQIDNNIGDVVFNLEPGYVVQVRVLDVDGNPIKGAKIEADEWRVIQSYSYRGRNIRLSAKTDSDGLAVIYDAPKDSVVYGIRKDSFSALNNFEMEPGEEEYAAILLKQRKITGRVYDAETNETIMSFKQTEGINWQGQKKPTWQTHGVKKVTNGTYNQNMYYQDEGYAVKIEAEGYAPSETQVYYNEGEDVVYDVPMYRAKDEQLEEGTVYLPDGNVAVGAQVGISRKNYSMQIKYGVINPRGNSTVLTTDANGKFKLPYQENEYRLIALHDKGVAEVSCDQFEVSGDIYLQEWGRVEGILCVGNKPAAGYQVNLECQQEDLQFNHYVDYDHKKAVGDDGKFVFKKVRPGTAVISRVVPTSDSGWSYANKTNIEVVPGQTVTVEIGGGGRKVVGKLVVPGYTYNQFDLRLSSIRIESEVEMPDISSVEMPEFNIPERYFVMTTEERQAWQQEIMQSPEFQEYQKKVTQLQQEFESYNYPLTFKSDGNFLAEDVLPGEYTINGDLYEKSSTGDYNSRNLIAKFNFEFMVDELPEDTEEEPVDIGIVGPTEDSGLVNELKPGDMAPGFTVAGLDGQVVKLSDYTGKFVILDLGGPTTNELYIETLPYLQDVYDEYARAGKLEIVTIALSYDYLGNQNIFVKPLKYLVKHENIKWKIGLENVDGMVNPTSKLFNSYGVPVYQNQYMLIGPDGRIAAIKIDPEELMDIVATAIENSPVVGQ